MSCNLIDYDFNLPSHLIASNPIYPRDSSKMLVYDRASGNITHSYFKDILDFIPKNTCFFFNDTKVIKARLYGNKTSGAKIELLINRPLDDNRFMVYIKGRIKVGDELKFEDGLRATIVKISDDGSREVEFVYDNKIIDFDALIEITNKIGQVPIPPYMKRQSNENDEIDYQSIFAKHNGSVASPTASLHFTKELYSKIEKNNDIQYITLHIGSGTFKPIEVENITKHNMHFEYYDIPTSSVDIINSSNKILAVGTTATRAIESYARDKKSKCDTNLFLHLDNKPKRVDYLVTNFHLPKSSLLVLVSSFVGLEKTKELYQEAINKEYRFYSYGDGMLII